MVDNGLPFVTYGISIRGGVSMGGEGYATKGAKSRRRETLNLLTDADRSTDTIFFLWFRKKTGGGSKQKK